MNANQRTWLTLGGILLTAVLLWFAVMPAARPETAGNPPASAVHEAAEEQGDEPATPAQPQAAPAPAGPIQQPPTAAPALPPAAPAALPGSPPPPKPTTYRPVSSGPVAQLKQTFESEPRESNASVAEAKIQAAFRLPHVPAELFRSVLCRKTVCRVIVNWKAERATGEMVALMNLLREFGSQVGYEPIGEMTPGGEQELHVYMTRSPGLPPGALTPAAARGPAPQ